MSTALREAPESVSDEAHGAAPREARPASGWRRRVLDVGALPRVPRIVVSAALGATAAASVIVLTTAVGGPGGAAASASAAAPVGGRAFLVPLLFCGIGIGAAGLALAATHPGWALPRPTLVGVALLGGALSGLLVNAAEDVQLLHLLTGEASGATQFSGRAAAAAGWLGIAAAFAVAAVPVGVTRRHPAVLAACAALPFALGLITYLVADRTGVPLDSLPTFRPGWDDPVSPALLIAPTVENMAGVLLFPVGMVLMWQAVEAARWAVDAGAGAAVRTAKASVPILVALVAVKVAWLGSGYAGWLPGFLGGGSDAWAASRADGPIAWAVAVLLAATAAAWVARRRGALVPTRGAVTAAWLVIFGFHAVVIAASAVLLLYPIVSVITPLDPQLLTSLVTGWSEALGDAIGVSQIAAVVAAVIAGAILVRRPERRGVGIFLLAIGVWALVRAGPILPELVDLGAPRSGWNPLAVELVTLDAVLTVAVAGLLIARFARPGAIAAAPAQLVLVLVASTVIAHGGTLLAGLGAAGPGGAAFALALVFPAASQFLWDADWLNARTGSWPLRPVAMAALAALIMTVIAFRVASGELTRSGVTDEDLGRVLLIVPLAALLVAGRLPARRD